MKNFLSIGIVAILMGNFSPGLVLAQSKSNPSESVPDGIPDSLRSLVFDTEREFGLYIQGAMVQSDSGAVFTNLDSVQIDSMFLALKRDKKLVIPKAHLPVFADFLLEESQSQKVMVQSLNLSPKDKELEFSFDVNEGDLFSLSFDPDRGGGYGAGIEVLFNAVRVSDEMALFKKERFSLDFIASRSGKVDVVFRNFGFFRIQGDISVAIKPRKEKIKLQEERRIQVFQKEINVNVKDTLFKTLFDEAIQVEHKLNLKGNSVFGKQLEILPDRKLLGFALFIYPSDQKEKLEIQRRDVFKEDPLEDFALKELIGKSYTYLPEFNFPDLDLAVMDFSQRNHWLNGETKASESWQSSPNSKGNYAFFKVKEFATDINAHVKVINKSALYNHELQLQIIAVFEGNFIVSESLNVQESEEIIILTLL
jgi:hypothetical protein